MSGGFYIGIGFVSFIYFTCCVFRVLVVVVVVVIGILVLVYSGRKLRFKRWAIS